MRIECETYKYSLELSFLFSSFLCLFLLLLLLLILVKVCTRPDDYGETPPDFDDKRCIFPLLLIIITL